MGKETRCSSCCTSASFSLRWLLSNRLCGGGSRVSIRPGAVFLSTPGEVAEAVAAGVEAPQAMHFKLREGVFGAARGAVAEDDHLSILSGEGCGTSCQGGSLFRT
eukprot:GHVU01023125.1.p1 GENE.GHVU01023125.1~~GHVU01023125.1.p1  ORF type:complete len:105 (+),score=7.04 GHVU01023125.1:208-522(+)